MVKAKSSASKRSTHKKSSRHKIFPLSKRNRLLLKLATLGLSSAALGALITHEIHRRKR